MAQKYVDLPGIGRVLLAKRRGSRNLRLTIRSDGVVRVGLPSWAPYAAGIKFALERVDWISSHLARLKRPDLADGHLIGKSFRLKFEYDAARKSVATRVSSGQITVMSPYPPHHDFSQAAAIKASERALKKDADQLLSIRLRDLADKHGYKFRSFKVKKLRSRWGSCSNQSDITLNIYLIQLPWRLIDYVIMHELTHTKHLNHSPEFWNSLESSLPGAKRLRREIHDYRPDVIVE